MHKAKLSVRTPMALPIAAPNAAPNIILFSFLIIYGFYLDFLTSSIFFDFAKNATINAVIIPIIGVPIKP